LLLPARLLERYIVAPWDGRYIGDLARRRRLLESAVSGLQGSSSVPEISRFFGIIIAMYYNDHAPPHFHVRYGSQRALVAIESLSVLEGKLSPRALGLVMEWASSHQDDLIEDWKLARAQAPLKAIEPLR